MKLIVGLGNPGREYEKTRHNIGFMCIDEIANYFNVNFNLNKFNGLYTTFNYNGDKVILLKPQKYMNLSGEVIADFVNYYKIINTDILIICDDLNLPVGKIRLRSKGRSGGHNGLKNIELMLATDEYKRLKIGIGNNNEKDMKDFVLGKFNSEEMKILEQTISKTDELLEQYLEENFEKLMSKYNG